MSVLTETRPRLLASAGLAAAALALVAFAALHVLAADTVDPVRRTISEYALGGDGWLFDVGVLALVAAGALVLVALVRAGLARVPSAGVVAYAVGLAGLVLVVVFEKTNWAVGPSLSGYVHRYASLVAFVAVPLGAVLIARRHRRDSAAASWAVWLGAATLAWLVAILAGVPLGLVLGRPWWQLLPLGLTERGMAATMTAAVVALGLWARRDRDPATITA